MDTDKQSPEEGNTPRGVGRLSAGEGFVEEGINYLLVIAIDTYGNGIPVLHNAVKDATDFRDTLWGGYRFEKQHTTTLFNADATQDAILDAFSNIKRQLQDIDSFVFYFAGHGWHDAENGLGYWLPADAAAGRKSTYLNNAEVVATFRTSRARHVFGIVDACFSASLFAQRAMDTGEMRYFHLPSRWLFTSGQVEPVADGEPGHNSPFAQAILAQLRYQRGAYLSVTSLWNEARKAIVYNAVQTPRCEPLQNAGHQNGEFFFIRKEAAPAELAPLAPAEQVKPSRGEAAGPAPAAPATLEGMPLEQAKASLSELLARGELEAFFAAVKPRLRQGASVRDTFILQEAQYNRLMKRAAAGLEKADNLDFGLRQVSSNLLMAVRMLKERDWG
ncbi:MAG: caspase family protein [Phaeodactylibacter sp.]|nr:caspase family protein [Phaeodactylibacter sp.]MCB9274281.1 caspase family protein [Lewinellaceae bacterium]